MLIRSETAQDAGRIRAVVSAAFPTPAEADLVEQLRTDGDMVLSLVAADGQRIIGHALFSRMTAPFPALGLAPVSVDPRRQRAGIGRRLIEEGLALAEATGWRGVFVLGDPAYYRRFGFGAERAAGFASPHAGPHLMALSLGADALPATTGEVAYASAFNRFS